MQVKLSEQISSIDAEIILRRLPDWIQDALIARGNEINYPIEAIVEMTIASFLDTEPDPIVTHSIALSAMF